MAPQASDQDSHNLFKYKVPDWWTQMVTVGYERIKGLRARGQRRDGSYEATKSKVFAVPLGRLYRAFADKRTRSREAKSAPPISNIVSLP